MVKKEEIYAEPVIFLINVMIELITIAEKFSLN